jgi:hypothetical protein
MCADWAGLLAWLLDPTICEVSLCAAACWMHKTAKQSKQEWTLLNAVRHCQWRVLVGRSWAVSMHSPPPCSPQQALERAPWHCLWQQRHGVYSLDVWLVTMVADKTQDWRGVALVAAFVVPSAGVFLVHLLSRRRILGVWCPFGLRATRHCLGVWWQLSVVSCFTTDSECSAASLIVCCCCDAAASPKLCKQLVVLRACFGFALRKTC